MVGSLEHWVGFGFRVGGFSGFRVVGVPFVLSRPDDAMRTYASCFAPTARTEGVRFTASGYSNIPK